jgi:hypothetical protein
MQPPAEELFLLGRIIAAVGAATDFATAPGAYASADWQWQTIDHKHLASAEHLAQARGDEGQPIGEHMQAAIEARDINPARQIVRLAQNTDGTFMMVLEVLRRSDCNENDLRVGHCKLQLSSQHVYRHPGSDITPVSKPLHQRVDQQKSRYNPIGVHWLLVVSDLVSAPLIVT